MDIFMKGTGVLDDDDANAVRMQLNLDKHDQSQEPVNIVIPDTITAVTPGFGMCLLRNSALSIWKSEDSARANLALMEHFELGPYRLKPEGGVETIEFQKIRHRLGNCVVGLFAEWERDNIKNNSQGPKNAP